MRCMFMGRCFATLTPPSALDRSASETRCDCGLRYHSATTSAATRQASRFPNFCFDFALRHGTLETSDLK